MAPLSPKTDIRNLSNMEAVDSSRTVSGSSKPSDVAIVGMSAILPGAGDARTFWEHTLQGFNAITEVPADRWDWRLYYDADPKAADKIISKWGGFVPDVPFDPLRYGMPPASLPSIEPVQLLLLEATRAAIDDAGYADRPFDRERTAVVLGMGGGAAQLAMGYAFRSYLPMLDTVQPGAGRDALKACEGLLPEWTEDSFPGFLLNVAAGRLANRFDLGGANYTVDAACGSSLAAASLAVRELETGAADVVILGGADTVQNPFTYLAFSKTQAFSPRGRCRPFDASADGIVISEGVAVLVLKRLSDAKRDGDRIYAVIKGVGTSSDGRAKGLTAPSPEGQVRALSRAYAKAEVAPGTVGYVEAHGTGTAVGDVVEVNAISQVFREAGVDAKAVAIGSVKSMIGHTKCAAGLAGLINASLALHHRVLPPTIGVEDLNPRLDLIDGPFRVETKARPWLHSDPDHPRRAGVSAFGFGGTNFHAVLEADDTETTLAPVRDWPAELFVWRSTDRAALIGDLDALTSQIEAEARPRLVDLARAVNAACPANSHLVTLAVVATSLDDLRVRLTTARQAISSGASTIDDPRGLYFAEVPAFAGQPVAFLFPGQGSQSVGMLNDLAIAFPEVRQGFEAFDLALTTLGRPKVGPRVFGDDATALNSTEIAQPAIGAASLGLSCLLRSLGVEANLVAGHSYGELVALHASGVLSVAALAELSHERGRLMQKAVEQAPGSMAAVSAPWGEVQRLIAGELDVFAVNENGPRQTVIAGSAAGVAQVVDAATKAGFRSRLLPVAGAFHTDSMAGATSPLEHLALRLLTGSPRLPTYSNLDATRHPTDLPSIARRLGEHVARPVRFASMVEAMHDDGARVFLEVGPGSVLSPLVGSILDGRPHLAVACDSTSRPGVASFLNSLAKLVVAGVPVRLARLSEGRSSTTLDLSHLPVGDGSPALSASTWMVNGSRSRPIAQSEPKRLGQGPALPLPDPAPSVSTERPASNGYHPPPAAPRSGKVMNQPPTPTPLPPRPSTPSARAGEDRVIEAFQETMRAFLEVQRSTMLAYLAGRSAPVALSAEPAPPVPEPVIERPAPLPRPRPVVVARPAVEPVAPVLQPAVGREVVAARLVEIVRDRTGYPSEMLGLDLDLEADLGIDSIKRVEILGTLRDSVPALNGSNDSSTMDALSRARTLGAIVDRVEEVIRRQSPKAEESPAPAESPVRRLVLEAIPAPLSDRPSRLNHGGVVLITDDGRGVARAIANDLESSGHPVVVAGPGSVDFSSPDSVDRLLDQTRQLGPLAAIIHALPLRDRPPSSLSAESWTERMGAEVKGLFLLAKGSAADLERASKHGGRGALIASTAMGGTFASTGSPLDFFPGHGGISGLVKTLAREWPGVRCRVVDVDPRDRSDAIASRLVLEAGADDGWSEVGYPSNQRIRLAAVPSPLNRGATPSFALAPGEPVIVTGGARGITSALTLELARAWRPTLLLLGRSPLPEEFEDVETAKFSSPVEIKAALHEKLRKTRGSVSPADLERAYLALRQSREIRANLRSLREAGSTVEYARVDVRDASALAKVLDGWRLRFGEPVGLIHGAGVIKDKLLRDKTADLFDEVVSTKLDGALNLARLLRPESIRFAALFSSIAGRFGNLGQSDYATANEVLNKLAIWLDARWPGRVVSLIWGPWSGVGMVADLEGHLEGQGLGMIPPDLGRSLLVDELRFGRKGEVEVIASGALGTLDAPIEVVRSHRLADLVR